MQSPASPSALLTADAELARLDAHFTRTLRALHRAPTAHLSHAQRRARSRHLEQLARYQARRRFPQNRLFRGRAVPHFIDASGTRCAMGHLIELAGGRDLVHHVAAHRNYATIAELADTPELLAWLEENGLSVSEAGLIQPSYCGKPADCVCNELATTVYEGDLTIVGPDATLVVTAVHGATTTVMVGDSMPADRQLAGDKAHVLAIPYQGVAYVKMVVDADQTIDVDPCFNLPVPQDLPKANAIAGLLAPDVTACELELAKADPAWNELQGDCGSVTAGGTMSASTSAAATTGSATTTSSASGSAGAGAGGAQGDGGSGSCSIGNGGSGAELAILLLAGAVALKRRRRR